MKKFLRRLVVTAVIGGMAANSVPVVSMLTVQAEETKEGITQEKIDAANDAYNDAEVKLEFLTMSDTEFGGKPEDVSQTQQVSYEAQNYLYQRIRDWAKEKNFNIEAIMDNGDVAGGNEAEYYDCQAGNKGRVQGWYRAVEQVFTENFGEWDPVYMMCSGNHDLSDVMGDTFDEKHKEDDKWYYGNSETGYVGNFHAKVNGYDFITLDFNGSSTFGYGDAGSGYQNFLKETLDEISSAEDYDPKKPIFVQAHSGYQGTTLGGQWSGVYDTMGMDLQNILADYPQAVVFSAHTHFPVEEETSIYQKNFTFVENGSMNYIYKDVPGDFIEGGYLKTGNADIPEKTCNFISVLEDGRTVIRRFDVTNERWIGMPWVVDTTNGKEGFSYTDDQRSTVAPWFGDSAAIYASDITETGLTFGFDQAWDDELVNHYEVTITDMFTDKPAVMKVKGLGSEKSVTGSFRALSRYYYRPNTMQFEISGLEKGRRYSVEIYAVDDFGNRSEQPLTGTFQMAGNLSFPEVSGGMTLPDDIEEGKFLEMNFEDTLSDSIGDGEGTASGNVSFTDSYRADAGKAISVGGSRNDYVDLGSRDEWNLGTDKDLTVNFWIKVNSCGGYGAILSNKNWWGWYAKGINIAPENYNTAKLEFTLGDDSNGVYATGDVPQYKGSWHMMTFTVDRTNQAARTYMDGVLYKETSIAGVGDMTSGLNMYLGVDASRQYGSTGFDMDDLEMWDRPLKEEDIQAYYNVTRDASDIIKEAIFYAEYRLDEIEQNRDNRIYDDTLTENLKNAVEAAKAAPADQMLEAYENLKTCVHAVESQSVRFQGDSIAKTGLEKLVAMVGELDASEYTEKSWEAVEKAAEAAEKLLASEYAAQKDFDEAVSNLVAALGNLEYGVQKLHLETAIQAADAILELGKNYEDVTALIAATEAGKAVLDNVDATQKEVDDAACAILDELFRMAKTADIKSLESLIDAAENLLNGNFTGSSLDNLKDRIEKAKEVAADQNRGDGDIREAYENLIDAVIKLERKGNKAALEAMLIKANEVLRDADAYVAATLEGLADVTADAQKVYDDTDAVQSEVNAAVKALTLQVAEARLLGDVNGDGIVTTADSAALLRSVAELDTLPDESVAGADVNRNGTVDTGDAVLILQYVSEKITAF